MARPVVLSSDALEGIHASPGRDLLLADTAEDMKRAILEVIEGHHPAIGRAARLAVEAHHCWPATLERLDKLMQDCSPADAKEAQPTRVKAACLQ